VPGRLSERGPYRDQVIAAFYDELEKVSKVVEDYGEAVGSLQPGDIINMTPHQPEGEKKTLVKSLTDKAWTAASSVGQGSYTHTAMYVGGGKIVEARIGEGVTIKPLSDLLEGKSFIILRPKGVSKEDRLRAAAFSKAQVGKDYDTTALAVAGAGQIFPDSVAKLTGHIADDALRKGRDKWQCGELVAAAYAKVGLTDLPTATSPADIRVSPHLETITSFGQPGFKETGPKIKPKAWKERRLMETVQAPPPPKPEIPAALTESSQIKLPPPPKLPKQPVVMDMPEAYA
jgi:uncharacterized protein YycO